MHDVRIHIHRIETDDGEDSVLASTWLEIDGQHVVDSSRDDSLDYSLVGSAPSGFLYLELFKPSDDLRARFGIDIISEINGVEPDPDVLWLHVRSVEFVERALIEA